MTKMTDPTPAQDPPEFVAVCKTEDIPVGEGLSFEVGEHIVAVFNDKGTFRAIDETPHVDSKSIVVSL